MPADFDWRDVLEKANRARHVAFELETEGATEAAARTHAVADRQMDRLRRWAEQEDETG